MDEDHALPRHLITAAGASTPLAGEQLYQQLYGKEIGMMRKMVGSSPDDDVKYGVPPGFQRPNGPGPSNGGNPTAAGMPHLPPNMMPEAIMYNKFQQQQQAASAGQPHASYFHNGDPSGATHLHKMEGLLKPCFEDHGQHHQQQQHPYGNYGANFHQQQHHHHQPQHFGPNTNIMESPFVNTFNGNQKVDPLHNPNNGGTGVQIKQETDTSFGGVANGGNNKSATNNNNDVLTLYGRGVGGVGSNSSSNPISGSNNSVSSKAEPNEFNLNYSNSTIKGENHTDDDSGIDKLTRLNHDNDTDQ